VAHVRIRLFIAGIAKTFSLFYCNQIVWCRIASEPISTSQSATRRCKSESDDKGLLQFTNYKCCFSVICLCTIFKNVKPVQFAVVAVVK